MTVGHVSRATAQVTPSRREPSRLARWALRMAQAAVLVLVAGSLVMGTAWALDGGGAVEDTWIGMLGAVALYAALVFALFGFAGAVVALTKHDYWRWLWVPVGVLPVLIGVGLLLEGFVFE